MDWSTRSTVAARSRIAPSRSPIRGTAASRVAGRPSFLASRQTPQGNLLVAVYTYDGGASHAHATLSPGTSTRTLQRRRHLCPQCQRVGSIPSKASNSAEEHSSTPIAVDAADNLYVGNYPHNILQSLPTPLILPKRTRVFHTRSPAHVSSVGHRCRRRYLHFNHRTSGIRPHGSTLRCGCQSERAAD